MFNYREVTHREHFFPLVREKAEDTRTITSYLGFVIFV